MTWNRITIVCLILALVVSSLAVAQYGRGRRWRGRFDVADPQFRNGVPQWETDAQFKSDSFTFVRVRYSSYGRRGGGWAVDYPDSDLNFSYRLQQLTTLDVDPNGKILSLTDAELFDHPWIYMIEPGGMVLSEPEVESLRRYLLNGGFLMVDDFWGEYQWENFYHQIKRVFPERELVELTVEHEIFHCVYDLEEMPQIPSIGHALSGWTTEIQGALPHYWAIYDDAGRMMAIICHNTDLGDGWEQEGESPEYFREFSEKSAYPLGINIVVYALTH